uniref:Reelin domain-containing protein n=1 Tax=Daphnia galeata TaxID=27404 RepID=A0A8J2WNH0_9CRUS|nr:unnamed protein product [Daphnia galeata]
MSRFSMLDSFLALLLMDRITSIQSLVYGAPIENCQSMYPQHDYYLPQWLNPPPYTLSASIILDDTSDSSNQYNARSLTGDKIVGSFDPDVDSNTAKLIDCHGGAHSYLSLNPSPDSQNAATHVLNLPKRVVNFVWKPPANFEGEFYFVATVVAEYKVFWTGIETPPFNIVNKCKLIEELPRQMDRN